MVPCTLYHVPSPPPQVFKRCSFTSTSVERSEWIDSQMILAGPVPKQKIPSGPVTKQKIPSGPVTKPAGARPSSKAKAAPKRN